MGLDMYLSASRYVSGWKHLDAERKEYEKLLAAFGLKPDVCPDAPSADVVVRVGYWRKAIAIHAWFVREVQGGTDNCQRYDVERKQLESLKAECLLALAAKDGVGKADATLPPQSGFFFGSATRDEWYYDNLARTVAIIDQCLAMPEQWTFQYQSSW